MYTSNNYYILLIITTVSFLIFTFVLDKLKFSSSIIIKLLQQVLFSIIIISLIWCVYYYVQTPIYCSTEDGGELSKSITEGRNSHINNSEGVIVNSNKGESTLVKDGESKDTIRISKDNKYYNLKIDKDVADRGFEVIGNAITKGFESIVPNAGAGTAAGAIGAGVYKATAGLPPLQRVGVVGATTLVGGAAAKVGIDIGSAITKHGVSSIKNSPHADTNIERIPSPDNNFSIHSMLESGETGESSPLFILIRSELFLDIFILILVISFLVLIFNKYILNYNLDLISNFVSKKSKRLHDWLISTNIKNKSNFYNNKLFFMLFIANSLLLIYMLFLKIYVTSVLFLNLDEYVQEHINITNSILLCISLKPNTKLSPIYHNKMEYSNTSEQDKFNNLPIPNLSLTSTRYNLDSELYCLKSNSIIQNYFKNVQTYISLITVILNNDQYTPYEKQYKIDSRLHNELKDQISNILKDKRKILLQP